MADLAPVLHPAGELIETPSAEALGYLRRAKADNTRRAYAADLREETAPGRAGFPGFREWCRMAGREALPASPTTVCDYLAMLADAGAKVSTIGRRLAAISQLHQAAGYVPPPTHDWAVRQVMAGIRRHHGAPARQKVAISGRQLASLVPEDDDRLAALRDRALLLIGFLGAFRRSELAALDVEDVQFTDDGLRVMLRRSKTDQEGHGEPRGVPRKGKLATDPVRALRAWLTASGITTGALWRPINRHGQLQSGRMSPAAVADVVKRACARMGLDPNDYGGHSLRAGLATAAAKGHAPEHVIRRQGGWRSAVVQRYIREGGLFEDNAGDYVKDI